jgi:alginate O-acetyltransferase complex protein AlgI
MLFTSYTFIAFLAAMFVLYYLVPKKFQWMLLLAGSYLFYAWAGIHFLAYILVTTVTTWYAAKRMTVLQTEQSAYLKAHKAELSREEKKALKAAGKKKTRHWMLFCLLLNLGILAVLKYTDFFISNINGIFDTDIAFMRFALPMGISFYTFQSMGYLLDVYRGKYAAQDSLGRFALFVSFFPQVIQGPISRYDDMAKTLYDEHPYDHRNISFGIQRICWGFFKKMVVADRILVAVNELIKNPADYTGAYVLAAMFFYAIELYADFTGGIDITIGIAQVFGVHLVENFERPFFSKNTAEYWRRWHITMGTWFRDYIFYPISVCQPMLKLSKASREKLGQALGKRVPVYLSTSIVWFVTGLWHGASWNFIVWGMLNCLVLIVSQEFEPFYAWFHKKFPKVGRTFWYRLFQVARTFCLMSAIRILDCYRDVPLTFHQVGTIFTEGNWNVLVNGSLLELGLSAADWGVILAGVLAMLIVSLIGRSGSVREKLSKQPMALRYGVYAALFLGVLIFGAYGIGFDASQFIYNQF